MNFTAGMVEILHSLILPTLTLTSNMLNHFVNFGATPPLTGDGSSLVNSLAQIAVNITETIARYLSYTQQ